MNDTSIIVPPSFGSAQVFLSHALNIGALELIPKGRQLKSGRISPHFFNSGLFKTGATLKILIDAYAASIKAAGLIPEVIFGPAYKGIPLAVGLSLHFNCDTEYSFNRKETKDHGEGGDIVGGSLKGKNVLIVDDVMTTGVSSGEAVEIIRANGGNPIGCAIAFDRQERSKDSEFSAVQEFQKNYGIPVYSAACLDDLILLLQSLPPESGDDESGEILEKILAYQNQYGVK